MMRAALEYPSVDWNGLGVYRPAKEVRLCEHLCGYKTINRTPLTLTTLYEPTEHVFCYWGYQEVVKVRRSWLATVCHGVRLLIDFLPPSVKSCGRCQEDYLGGNEISGIPITSASITGLWRGYLRTRHTNSLPTCWDYHGGLSQLVQISLASRPLVCVNHGTCVHATLVQANSLPTCWDYHGGLSQLVQITVNPGT